MIYRLKENLLFFIFFWGRFQQHFCTKKSCKRDEKLFFWRMANKFGKKCGNLSLKFGLLFVGDIGNFRLGKKSLLKSTLVVNLINILRAAFCANIVCQKFTISNYY